MKRGDAPWRHRIEVLVRDRISPVDEFLKQFAPTLVPHVQPVHFSPEVDPQPVEIGTDGAGVRTPSIEASMPDKLDS
jgi:hypothetical protein